MYTSNIKTNKRAVLLTFDFCVLILDFWISSGLCSQLSPINFIPIKSIRTLRKSVNSSTTKRKNVMEDNLDSVPSRRLTRKEEEELFSAIIAGYLKDKIDLEIYPKGISIKEKSNPRAREIFFPFEEEDEKPDGYPEE